MTRGEAFFEGEKFSAMPVGLPEPADVFGKSIHCQVPGRDSGMGGPKAGNSLSR
jgi:hypothetical protein